MPTTAELIELTKHSQETSARMMSRQKELEQQRATLFPPAHLLVRSSTVEGSLALSDQPTRYDLTAISPLTPLPAILEEPVALVQLPFTLPSRTPTAPIATEEPSPPVAVAAPVSYMTYNHTDMRSSPQQQIEAAILWCGYIPEHVFLSRYCKLILELMSWGPIYHYEGYQIHLAAENELEDDQVKLVGRQGELPQPKTVELPAWIADLAERKEEATCGGVGGDGGDGDLLRQAS